MKVLQHVQSLEQGDGGLAVAVAGFCSELADGGDCEVDLLLPGRRADPVPISGAVSVTERPVSNAGAAHFLPLPDLAADLEEAEFGLVHQHGLWTRSMRAVARFAGERGIPLVISPHGMLESWALSHHRFRKRIAWRWYQENILNQAEVLHASSEMEADQFRRLGLRQEIAVIPNGVAPGWRTELSRPRRDPRVAVFLSRLHPKKGIELLVEAWDRVGPGGWELRIYGEGSPAYRSRLEALAGERGLRGSVRFLGPVYGEEKWKALGEGSLFVLPSHSENFGIAVAEALQAGLPVITTKATPWRVVAEKGAGWWVSPDAGDIASALEEAVSLPESGLAEMGEKGRRLAESEYQWHAAGRAMRAFYAWLLGEGGRPDFVIDSPS